MNQGVSPTKHTLATSIPPTSYRPDIDGLRALAVLLVVGYHMNLALPHLLGLRLGRMLHRPSGLISLYPRGGFIGVDIFFVISGYLISGILLRQQENGTFSVARFYERRIRRIAPALFAILLFTTAAAYRVFLVSEMKDFAWSGIAALFSWSNIFFWKTSSYFDLPSLSKPLLHTWSLSVEEQFYLVFPFFLLLIRKFSLKARNAIVLGVMLLSFVASEILLKRDASAAAFYLPFSRAWELMIGTVLALGIVPPLKSALQRNLASLAGLAMLGYAAFRYTGQTEFPGVAALLPCIGSGLILAAGMTGSSFVGKILSLRPVVFLGLISYSLYLWHWPILLAGKFEYFLRFRFSDWSLFWISMAVAIPSWKFIEQPFRRTGHTISRRTVYVAAALTAMLFTGFYALAIASNGLPSRMPGDLRSLNDYGDYGRTRANWGDGCFASEGVPNLKKHCLEPSADKQNFLLFGDSQAAHLFYGLSTQYPEIQFEEATGSSCKPLLRNMASHERFCRDLTRQIFNADLPSKGIHTVILSAIWTREDVPGLAKTVAFLKRKQLRVDVVGLIPYYDQALPELIYRARVTGDQSFVHRHRSLNEAEYRDVDAALFHATLENGGYRYISLRNLLCPNEECLEYAMPGIPLQSDTMHLTNEGSLLVAQRIRERHLLP